MVHFQDPCHTSQLLWRWEGLDPKVYVLTCFYLFEHFPPSTEWTWSQNFMTPKFMVFLNVMPFVCYTGGHVLEEHWYLSTRLHDISSQKMVMFRVTNVRTSKPTLDTVLNTQKKNGRDHMIYSIPNFKCSCNLWGTVLLHAWYLLPHVHAPAAAGAPVF